MRCSRQYDQRVHVETQVDAVTTLAVTMVEEKLSLRISGYLAEEVDVGNEIAFAKTPRKVRQLSYEELVIRYGVDIPFETDMPVRQQQDAIGKWKSWATANEGRFKPGAWYVGGQLVGVSNKK